MVDIEVWVLVDEGGDYQVGATADDVAERYQSEVGADDATAKRLVKVVLKVPLPKPVELVGEVPAEAEGGELRVV